MNVGGPPPPGGGPEMMDPWGDNNNNNGGMDATTAVIWRERERRQRTVRILLMFLLMLLLMDGEDGNGNNPNNNRKNRGNLRRRRGGGNGKKAYKAALEPAVFEARQRQDATLRSLVQDHPRFLSLRERNGGRNVDSEVWHWAEQQDALEKDAFDNGSAMQTQPDGVVVAATPSRVVPPRGAPTHGDHLLDADPEADRKVYHYPWNTTGFYRGQWIRENWDKGGAPKNATHPVSAQDDKAPLLLRHAPELEATMLQVVRDKQQIKRETQVAGVYIVPPGQELRVRDDNNLTSLQWELRTVDSSGHMYPPSTTTTTTTTASELLRRNSHNKPVVTLTQNSGKAAFQLYSRPVPSMKELSLVDGFIKLYDQTSPGYSTRRDVLLRVRGVLIHAIGRLSLVANVGVTRSALVINQKVPATTSNTAALSTEQESGAAVGQYGEEEEQSTEEEPLMHSLESDEKEEDEQLQQQPDEEAITSEEEEAEERLRRRLQQVEGLTDAEVEEIRESALELYKDNDEAPEWSLASPPEDDGQEEKFPQQSHPQHDNEEVADDYLQQQTVRTTRRLIQTKATPAETDATPASSAQQSSHADPIATKATTSSDSKASSASEDNRNLPRWSDIVLPYPYVRDDTEESFRKFRTPAARRMPPSEQPLEANAAACEFEINLNVQELEWTVGQWRALMARKWTELKLLNPATRDAVIEASKQAQAEQSGSGSHHHHGATTTIAGPARPRSRKLAEQALVMTMTGQIHSENCDFTAFLNATALRTDWEATTSKAINYSFYMMLVCLTQIIILLRQLLHSQAQSAATRVSMICIGWQTVGDALICLAHIYLSLAMQPLFTAFASVAFFKLLIFCVIEMKYMAIIIQARNSANGGASTEVLRRQVAVLHLRVYVSLFGTFLFLFYIGERYRMLYMLGLYSFWVPQIILNIVTEAKTPLHKYYIYGMSLTRMVAPIYVFCIRNNFLKEVYPEAPYDPLMCQVLVLWVGAQAAVLIAQGKYGARFMIPARFLPPKFDYHRPIPASLLPPGAAAALEGVQQRQEFHSSYSSSSGDHHDDGLSCSLDGGKDSLTKTTTTTTTTTTPARGPQVERHTTSVTTRNRIRGNRASQGTVMTTETTADASPTTISSDGGGTSRDTSPTAATLPTLDCSICYDSIDVRDRSGYMLAPCDHLFHRKCLEQWMDVKMECPICRTELPAL